MKKMFLLPFIGLLSIICVGCQRNDPTIPTDKENLLSDTIYCAPHSISFDFTGGEKSIIVTSEKGWDAIIKVDWLALDKTAGKGTQNVKVICQAGSLDTTIIYFRNDVKSDSVCVIRGKEGLTLNTTSLALHKNEEYSLIASFKSGRICSPLWTSSNTSVIAIDDDGKISAINYGDAIVTAEQDGFIARCTIKVLERGYFKVGNKYLKFAPGNFGYDKSTKSCYFESPEYQYGYLAQWGSGSNPDCTCAHGAYYHNTYVDWGTNEIKYEGITYPANTWRAPTSSEFSAALNNEHATATIEGIHGVILLPSDWEMPEGITFNNGYNGWNHNIYTANQWQKMSKAGAIFLPASGYGSNSSINPYTRHDRGSGCFYWPSGTSSAADKGTYFKCYSTVTFTSDSWYKEFKCSVRLVREL